MFANIIEGVIILLVGTFILWMIKPLRKLITNIFKRCWHFMTLPFVGKKHIDSLENKISDKIDSLRERIVTLEKWQLDKIKAENALLDFVTFCIAVYSKDYISSVSLLIDIADRSGQKENELITKSALTQAIECLKNITPPLAFQALDQEIKILHSLEKIKNRSNIYSMEIEQIEKLLKEKKYPPPTVNK